MEYTHPHSDTTVERAPRADSFSDVDEMHLYVHSLLREVYRNDDIVMMWLNAPNANLDNNVPLSMLHTDPDRVLRLVVAFNKSGEIQSYI